MSYVEVFVIDQNGDAVSFGEASNNHGFAPLVWEKLAKQYEVISPDGYVLLNHEALQKLWDMQGTDKLAKNDDIILGATFDRVWVKRDRVPSLVEACLDFHKRYILPGNLVRTIASTAALLKQAMEQHPEALGVAFNMCSANSAFWTIYDPEKGDSRPYNVLKDQEHPGDEYQGQQPQTLSWFESP